MGSYSHLFLALIALLPITNALALPFINKVDKRVPIQTVFDYVTELVYITVTADGGGTVTGSATPVGASTSTAIIEDSALVAFQLPSSTTPLTTSTSTAFSSILDTYTPPSIASTTSTTSTPAVIATSIVISIPTPTFVVPSSTATTLLTTSSSPAAAATGGPTGYGCTGPSNTITFTIDPSDSVTRTIVWTPNASNGLTEYPPTIVPPGSSVPVAIECGWAGNFYSTAPEFGDYFQHTLGEVTFNGGFAQTYYDVSEITNTTDNNGIHWCYTTSLSGPLSGCDNFLEPENCHDYYKSPDDLETQGSHTEINAGAVGLTCILGNSVVARPEGYPAIY